MNTQMVGCLTEHCWHLSSSSLTVTGMQTTEVCCHCGSQRVLVAADTPRRPHGHGPYFAPPLGPVSFTNHTKGTYTVTFSTDSTNG